MRGNRIQGGIGNGITLGSVRVLDANGDDEGFLIGWVVNAADPCSPCKPGDIVIVVDTGGDGRRVVSAGPLTDIRIDDNLIVDMGLNGIGPVGFFEPASGEVVTVDGLEITRNEIRRCLWRPLVEVDDGFVDAVGYGGVVLADVSRVDVRENRIEDNGADAGDPVCGVFVLHGDDGVEIAANRIVGNGALTRRALPRVRPGRRGGIVVLYCLAPTVDTPVGQALPGTPVGTVVSRGLRVASPPWSFTTTSSARRSAPPCGPPPSAPCRSTPTSSPPAASSPGAARGPCWARPCYSSTWGRPTKVTSNSISSTRSRPARPSLPRPASLTTAAPSSSSSRASTTSASAALANGNVLFSDNQCVLSLLESGQSFSFVSVLIFSLDDVAFLANQCDCDLAFGDGVLTQLLVYAPSVRVCDNRFKEGWANALLSAVPWASC